MDCRILVQLPRAPTAKHFHGVLHIHSDLSDDDGSFRICVSTNKIQKSSHVNEFAKCDDCLLFHRHPYLQSSLSVEATLFRPSKRNGRR
jgi:hypothetical protein